MNNCDGGKPGPLLGQQVTKLPFDSRMAPLRAGGRAGSVQQRASALVDDQYNPLFTMHGVTMIFLCALPILSGFSNFLRPLLLGSRDMAFPRLNALSLWIFLLAGIVL